MGSGGRALGLGDPDLTTVQGLESWPNWSLHLQLLLPAVDSIYLS